MAKGSRGELDRNARSFSENINKEPGSPRGSRATTRENDASNLLCSNLHWPSVCLFRFQCCTYEKQDSCQKSVLCQNLRKNTRNSTIIIKIVPV